MILTRTKVRKVFDLKKKFAVFAPPRRRHENFILGVPGSWQMTWSYLFRDVRQRYPKVFQKIPGSQPLKPEPEFGEIAWIFLSCIVLGSPFFKTCVHYGCIKVIFLGVKTWSTVVRKHEINVLDVQEGVTRTYRKLTRIWKINVNYCEH